MSGCTNSRCKIRRRMGGSPEPGANADCKSKRSQTGLPSEQDVKSAAARYHLSTGESLLEASEKRVVALVFLRHFGCTFTRQILRGLEELHQQCLQNHAELVLVHMLGKGKEARHLGAKNEVARIADPRCELYRNFGLGNGGILELFGPRVWWLGTLSIFKGCGVGHLAGNALQMPGSFLFHHGKIIAAQPAKSASDLPQLSRLFDTCPTHEPPPKSR